MNECVLCMRHTNQHTLVIIRVKDRGTKGGRCVLNSVCVYDCEVGDRNTPFICCFKVASTDLYQFA